MANAELEIERKFLITAAVEARLAETCAQHGFAPKTKDMTDVYWDSGPVAGDADDAAATGSRAPYALTSADAWLRSRNDTWELKWPVIPVAVQVSSLRARLAAGDYSVPPDQYTEHTSHAEIAAKLAGLGVDVDVPAGPEGGKGAFADALTAAGLRPFTSIRTIRTRYTLNPALLPRMPPVSGSNTSGVGEAAFGAASALSGAAAPMPAVLQGCSLGVDVDEVSYTVPGAATANTGTAGAGAAGAAEGALRYRLAEVEVVVPLGGKGGGEGDGSTSSGFSRDEAVAAADALIAHACAVFGISPDHGDEGEAAGSSGATAIGAGTGGGAASGTSAAPRGRPKRIPGKVVEFLRRYDQGRLGACRAVGLLAIKQGEELPPA